MNFISIKAYQRLFESRETKNISKARKVCASYGDSDPHKTTEDVRNLVPNIRAYDCKFLPAACRMHFNGELQDDEVASRLNSVIKYLGAHVDEYDHDLNGMKAEDIINRFSGALRQDIEKDKEKLSGYVNQNSDYEIVRIPSYEEASKYSQYVTWCVTQDERAYRNYTKGTGIFYFLLKKGYQDLDEATADPSADGEYAMSMIAVSVNGDGSLNTSTCRWNHEHDCNDNMYDTTEISELLGGNFYELCPPKDLLGDFKKLVASGEARVEELPYGFEMYVKNTDNPECILVRSDKIMSDNIYTSYKLFGIRLFLRWKEGDYTYADIYDLGDRDFKRKDHRDVGAMYDKFSDLYEQGIFILYSRQTILYNIKVDEDDMIGNLNVKTDIFYNKKYIVLGNYVVDYNFRPVSKKTLYDNCIADGIVEKKIFDGYTGYVLPNEYMFIEINGDVKDKLFRSVDNNEKSQYLIAYSDNNNNKGAWSCHGEIYDKTGEKRGEFSKLLVYTDELLVYETRDSDSNGHIVHVLTNEFVDVFVAIPEMMYVHKTPAKLVANTDIYSFTVYDGNNVKYMLCNVKTDEVADGPYEKAASFMQSGTNMKYILCSKYNYDSGGSVLFDKNLKIVVEYEHELENNAYLFDMDKSIGILRNKRTKQYDFFSKETGIIQNVTFQNADPENSSYVYKVDIMSPDGKRMTYDHDRCTVQVH